MPMFVILFCLSWMSVHGEPDDVIIQYLYKPKDCKDMGKHGDTMHVQYLGRFYDSKKVFDSSYSRNNVPFNYVLGVGGVIEGYQIGTQNMCINERRRLIVPSKYAYGSQGTGNIPGYATLMFDVHLVQINDAPPGYPVPIELPTEVNVEGEQNCEHPVKMGDVLEISYLGSLADGTIFDNSTETLKFVVGSSQILPGIDYGLISFCKGSVVQLEIPPVKAYADKWEGPVPQWSYVYYNVTIVSHIVRESLDDGDDQLTCENLTVPNNCHLAYHVQAGDYIKLFYRVLDSEKESLGESEIRYPVGRQAFVPGFDRAIIGSCAGQHKLCWIPSYLAHKVTTSLFLAPPEKGFWTELKVEEVLLTHDDRDAADLRVTETMEDVSGHQNAIPYSNTGTHHVEL